MRAETEDLILAELRCAILVAGALAILGKLHLLAWRPEDRGGIGEKG